MNKLLYATAAMLIALILWGSVSFGEGMFQTVNAYYETKNSKAIEILFGK